jgi:hypothetical protein
MLHYLKIIVIISDKIIIVVSYMFFIEHNYSQSVIYNFKSELKFWKIYNLVKLFFVMIIIARIIIH